MYSHNKFALYEPASFLKSYILYISDSNEMSAYTILVLFNYFGNLRKAIRNNDVAIKYFIIVINPFSVTYNSGINKLNRVSIVIRIA